MDLNFQKYAFLANFFPLKFAHIVWYISCSFGYFRPLSSMEGELQIRRSPSVET
jgi:hypothetical protein